MFLALGVGAWSAGDLPCSSPTPSSRPCCSSSAGVVIEALDDEHDIFKMGGLRTRLPVAFWTFLIGAAALAALPIVTAGFYSKDLIIDRALQSTEGGFWLWIAGIVGSLLTGLYAFRAVFVVFFGPARTEPRAGFRTGLAVRLPLFVLALLAIVGGLIDIPRGWAHLQKLDDFLAPVLPAAPLRHGGLAGDLWTTVRAGRRRPGRHRPRLAALRAPPAAWRPRPAPRSPRATSWAAGASTGSTATPSRCRSCGSRHVSRNDLFEPPVDAIAAPGARRLARPVGHPERPRALVSCSSSASASRSACCWWCCDDPASCRCSPGPSSPASPPGSPAAAGPTLARWVSALAMAAGLVAVVVEWIVKAPDFSLSGHGPFVASVHVAWVPQLGISFFVAADGLSLLMVTLLLRPRPAGRAVVVARASPNGSASSISCCSGRSPAWSACSPPSTCSSSTSSSR